MTGVVCHSARSRGIHGESTSGGRSCDFAQDDYIWGRRMTIFDGGITILPEVSPLLGMFY